MKNVVKETKQVKTKKTKTEKKIDSYFLEVMEEQFRADTLPRMLGDYRNNFYSHPLPTNVRKRRLKQLENYNQGMLKYATREWNRLSLDDKKKRYKKATSNDPQNAYTYLNPLCIFDSELDKEHEQRLIDAGLDIKPQKNPIPECILDAITSDDVGRLGKRKFFHFNANIAQVTYMEANKTLVAFLNAVDDRAFQFVKEKAEIYNKGVINTDMEYRLKGGREFREMWVKSDLNNTYRGRTSEDERGVDQYENHKAGETHEDDSRYRIINRIYSFHALQNVMRRSADGAFRIGLGFCFETFRNEFLTWFPEGENRNPEEAWEMANEDFHGVYQDLWNTLDNDFWLGQLWDLVVSAYSRAYAEYEEELGKPLMDSLYDAQFFLFTTDKDGNPAKSSRYCRWLNTHNFGFDVPKLVKDTWTNKSDGVANTDSVKEVA